MIDLTWATPKATRTIDSWRVAEEMEILSGHKVEICVSIFSPAMVKRIRERRAKKLRWVIRKMDEHCFAAAITAATWATNWEERTQLRWRIKWLQETLKCTCDVAMLKTWPNDKAPIYWWTEEIAQL